MKSAAYGRDQVVKIINSVIDKVQHADELARDTLFLELQSLKNVIEEARRELGSARPGDISGIHIPAATDELEAIVGGTEEATGTIMDACEVIQEAVSGVGGEAETTIGNEVVKIYEACSFQDITGQRITKIVRTLQTIENKVGRILEVLEHKMPGIEENEPEEPVKPAGPESLLNGPQMPDKAITQDDIDRLLAEFDN